MRTETIVYKPSEGVTVFIAPPTGTEEEQQKALESLSRVVTEGAKKLGMIPENYTCKCVKMWERE